MSYINPAKYFPQKATYWSQKKQDGFGGEEWEPPVVISCRWESITDEALSPAYKVVGEAVVSRSTVYTPSPLIEGGYLYLGETTDANPSRLKGAFVIRAVMMTPGVRDTFREHTAHL